MNNPDDILKANEDMVMVFLMAGGIVLAVERVTFWDEYLSGEVTPFALSELQLFSAVPTGEPILINVRNVLGVRLQPRSSVMPNTLVTAKGSRFQN